MDRLEMRRETVGIVKHGEGEVLPENEQQKIAQQGGMDEQTREALARENDEADGGGTSPAES